MIPVKIAFVVQPNPVLLDEENNAHSPVRTNLFPIAQLTLANIEGHDLELLDLRSIEGNWRDEKLTEYAPSFRYGKREFRRYLIGDYASKIKSADVYVLTANFTSELNSVKATAKELRRSNPKSRIIIGGRDVELSPEEYSRIPEIDHVVVGNSKQGLQKVIDSPEDVGKIVDIGKESTLPRPNLDLIANMPEYESGGGKLGQGLYAYIQTSRGCPHRCNFCTEDAEFIESDVSGIKKIIDDYAEKGVGIFGFIDSNILCRSEEDLFEIFNYLKKKGLTWEFPAGLEIKRFFDGERFKEELADLVLGHDGQSGMHRALIPLEDCLIRYSHHNKCQDLDYERVLDYLIEKEVPYVNIAIMIGHPEETKENRDGLMRNLRKIYDRFKKSKTTVNFSVFCSIPIPGTGFHEQMSARIKYDHREYPELYTVFNGVIDGDNYSAEEITEFRERILEEFDMQQDEGKVNPNDNVYSRA
ncbi:B12-binding domain-containing radical SAM protein [Nanoarchaeota archaeon]